MVKVGQGAMKRSAVVRQNVTRTDKRFPPRGVCLLIQDSLLLQMFLQRHGSANDGNVTRISAGDNKSCSRSTELEPKPQQRNDGATRRVAGRTESGLPLQNGSRPDALPECPSPVPDAFGPHGSSEHIRPSAA